MITEKATVKKVEKDLLVVETIQQSTCGSCSARKGCGQGVLAKYMSSSSFFKVALQEGQLNDYKAGDLVELGIDELALVRASMWLYLVPLAGLLVGVYTGSLISESMSIFGALMGLFSGLFLSFLQAQKVKSSPDYSPVLLADTTTIRMVIAEDSLRA